jgi:hypothetical protein
MIRGCPFTSTACVINVRGALRPQLDVDALPPGGRAGHAAFGGRPPVHLDARDAEARSAHMNLKDGVAVLHTGQLHGVHIRGQRRLEADTLIVEAQARQLIEHEPEIPGSAPGLMRLGGPGDDAPPTPVTGW